MINEGGYVKTKSGDKNVQTKPSLIIIRHNSIVYLGFLEIYIHFIIVNNASSSHRHIYLSFRVRMDWQRKRRICKYK